MRVSFDIYAILGYFAFVVLQGCVIAYTSNPIVTVIWFFADVCKFMAILYIAATAKVKKGEE